MVLAWSDNFQFLVIFATSSESEYRLTDGQDDFVLGASVA